ncbi:MAG: hypothetical protein KF715_14540 [Candidatus Didemnitutus sp.]|nr:hypothetical protein [Candidatus Didemnitutus sp.]
MLLDELETEPRISVPQLRQWHERNCTHARYAQTVAEAIVSGSPALEWTGAWLLRRWLSDGGLPPLEAWTIVVDGLDGVRSHLGRLILCQLWAEKPELIELAPAEVTSFLREQLDDPKATVRVWSLNALWFAAKRHPELRADVRAAVRRAKRDPEACVQARLRQMGLVPYPEKKKPAAKGGGR